MNRSIYIGNVEFILTAEQEFTLAPELSEFVTPVCDTARKVRCRICFEEYPKPLDFQFRARIEYPPQMIGRTDHGECRIYQNLFDGHLEAVYKENADDSVTLTLYGIWTQDFAFTLDMLNYLAMERNVMKAGSLILHSSFIVVNGEAILFTAPSGTGKSTQADLWARYRNAAILNGDRSLMVNTDNGWRVCGFPFSGSSGICHNGSFPVKAIIMIHQSPENGGFYVSHAQAFKTVYPDIVRNYWDMEYEETVCRQLEALFAQIPAVRYGCNMEEEAVNCLERILNTGNRYEENNQKQ